MSAPTEKHRETASELAESIAGLVLDHADARHVELNGPRWIAEALAAAEERGMKRGLERAAEIAREEANGRRKQSDDKSRFNSFERRDFDSMSIACHQVAAAITNEITPSPAAPSQRATADEGVSPPSSSSAPIQQSEAVGCRLITPLAAREADEAAAPIHDEASK